MHEAEPVAPDIAEEMRDVVADDRVVLKHYGRGWDLVMERAAFEEMVASARAQRERAAEKEAASKQRWPWPAPPRFDPATEAELDEAAKITLEDIERARQAWMRDAPPEARDLLDAEREDGPEGVSEGRCAAR